MKLAGKTLEQIVMYAIESAIKRNGGNKALAATELKIHEKTIRNKLNLHKRAHLYRKKL